MKWYIIGITVKTIRCFGSQLQFYKYLTRINTTEISNWIHFFNIFYFVFELYCFTCKLYDNNVLDLTFCYHYWFVGNEL